MKEIEITMLNWLRERKKDNKGFTLVELIIVIAILAILVGLLAPQYMKYVEKSRKSTDVSNLERLVEAVKIASADTDYNIPYGTYTIKMETSGTTISVTGTPSGVTNKITNALKEYAGYNFTLDTKNTSLKLKSNRWGADSISGGSGTISAKIEIGSDSSVTVSYSSTDVTDLSSEKTATTTTP